MKSQTTKCLLEKCDALVGANLAYCEDHWNELSKKADDYKKSVSAKNAHTKTTEQRFREALQKIERLCLLNDDEWFEGFAEIGNIASEALKETP